VDGKYYVLYFILVTKFSDMGAYVVGSLIGRHKMIPRISPGKTWEGFWGAVVGFHRGEPGVRAFFWRPHAGDEHAARGDSGGMILSSTAVVGDLIESLFKREAGRRIRARCFRGSAAFWTCGQPFVQCADHVSLSAPRIDVHEPRVDCGVGEALQ
jgi:predicted CDP-diglyceride synthetase/phosphatidate cytidylyltransferase